MSSLPKPSVVLFVDDVRQMAHFYRSLAALSVVHDALDHAVLATDGMELVIHALPAHPKDEPTRSGPVAVREDSYLKVCLPVPSIAAARAIAASLGGQIAPIAEEWQARGFRACDGHDPEGNVLQVREPAG